MDTLLYVLILIKVGSVSSNVRLKLEKYVLLSPSRFLANSKAVSSSLIGHRSIS